MTDQEQQEKVIKELLRMVSNNNRIITDLLKWIEELRNPRFVVDQHKAS